MTAIIDKQIETILKFENEKNFDKAEYLYNEILEENFDNADILNTLAILRYRNKQFDKAVSLFKRAIEIEPTAELYTNLGEIYIYQENFYEAINCFKEAIILDFNNFNSWFLLAYSLKSNMQFDDAIIAYQKALSLNPNSTDVYHNLGNIYSKNKNDPHIGIECYKKYLEYVPDDNDAKSCLGTLYLKTKNYKDGWAYFEHCINKAMAIIDRASIKDSSTKLKPVWQGENIEDKTIYVYYDGGLGDIMMFARFLPLLRKKCKKVIFRPQINTIQLFKDSDLGIDILDENTQESELKFDVHTPLMSLPYKLGLDKEEDIPFSEGYLKAVPQKVEFYNQEYFKTDKFKIGIKWQGDTTFDTTRKIMLKSFYKLFSLPNVKFYSLQKGDGIEQLKEADGYEIVDLGSIFNDFSDTAAAIENLDLVICNDTSVAHLTGALNKPCWVLLPYTQDWRWSVDLSYCPWYKSLRFFKQSQAGNWDGVFDEVYKELKNKLTENLEHFEYSEV